MILLKKFQRYFSFVLRHTKAFQDVSEGFRGLTRDFQRFQEASGGFRWFQNTLENSWKLLKPFEISRKFPLNPSRISLTPLGILWGILELYWTPWNDSEAIWCVLEVHWNALPLGLVAIPLKPHRTPLDPPEVSYDSKSTTGTPMKPSETTEYPWNALEGPWKLWNHLELLWKPLKLSGISLILHGSPWNTNGTSLKLQKIPGISLKPLECLNSLKGVIYVEVVKKLFFYLNLKTHLIMSCQIFKEIPAVQTKTLR